MHDAGTATVTVARRRCRGCGLPLSRYNPENSCRACVRGSTESACTAYGDSEVHPLRRARHRRGMTLETLAGLSGLSAAFLSRVENGHRELCRRSHITALAASLRVPPVDLVPWVLSGPEPANWLGRRMHDRELGLDVPGGATTAVPPRPAVGVGGPRQEVSPGGPRR